MPISPGIYDAMNSSSWIRKMFEEGNRLRGIYGADKVFDFSLGNPDLEPPDEVKKAIREVALDTADGLHAYMSNAGYAATRDAMGAKVSSEQGVAVPGSHVVMSVGAAGALNAVLKAILAPDNEVIVPAPFFAEYTHYVKNHGGVLVPVETGADFSLDVQKIKAHLTPHTAAVLINSPNNPTGKIYSDRNIAELADVLRKHADECGRIPYLIADEPYRDIVYDGKTVAPVFKYYDSAVIVTSFAKNLSLPGERIGYIAVNPACPDHEELIAACIFTTRILGYVNAPAFFQRVIEKSWNAAADYSSYADRRTLITGVMDDAGISYAVPEGAFYLFAKVPGGSTDDVEFCSHLKQFNILAVPGTGFGCSGWIRLAYCVPAAVIENSRSAFIQAAAAWKNGGTK